MITMIGYKDLTHLLEEKSFIEMHIKYLKDGKSYAAPVTYFSGIDNRTKASVTGYHEGKLFDDYKSALDVATKYLLAELEQVLAVINTQVNEYIEVET